MNLALLCSGGDAPGMNAAVRAVVRAALARKWTVQAVHGGYSGIFNQEFEPMHDRSVSRILHQGGTVIGTGRCPEFRDPEGRARAAAILTKRDVDALVVVGGNGSYAGLSALHEETGFRCVGIPGSIDNDVGGTDPSIGFDTAVNTAIQAIDRIRDTAFSYQRLFYVEVMGRHSGQIAASVAVGSGAEAVVVPEFPVDLDGLSDHIGRGYKAGKRSAIVIVAEGAVDGGARGLADAVATREPELSEARIVVLGYIQRGGSPSAADRLLASHLGVRAIEALADGEDPCVVGNACDGYMSTPLGNAVTGGPTLSRGDIRLANLLAGLPDPVS